MGESKKDKEARLVEITSSKKETIEVKDGMEAEVAIVSMAPADKDLAVEIEARIGKNASLKLVGCHLGGKEAKYSVSVEQGQASKCEHYEIGLLGGSQRLIARTSHLHGKEGSYSRSHFRYAAAGSAQVDLEGNVEIARKAKGADAHFVAKSLLFSRDARMRLVPMLSVKTGEVKAGHGAAMAPVSADELFYLGARGIDGKEGRRMILLGFLLEPVASAKIDSGLAAQVERRILEKMGGLDGF
ncbi:MAG: SufD family Fe-S cluster assembly protein [Candidatus Micrarchaeia archaeon]